MTFRKVDAGRIIHHIGEMVWVKETGKVPVCSILRYISINNERIELVGRKIPFDSIEQIRLFSGQVLYENRKMVGLAGLRRSV